MFRVDCDPEVCARVVGGVAGAKEGIEKAVHGHRTQSIFDLAHILNAGAQFFRALLLSLLVIVRSLNRVEPGRARLG